MEILLREYRCKNCGKLLCKGLLKHADSILELKCRGCGEMSTFYGREIKAESEKQNEKRRIPLGLLQVGLCLAGSAGSAVSFIS